MIEANSLDANKFRLVGPGPNWEGVFEEKGFHPSTGDPLGYLHSVEKAGTVDFVNYGAQLPLSSLALGYTTSEAKKDLLVGMGKVTKLQHW